MYVLSLHLLHDVYYSHARYGRFFGEILDFDVTIFAVFAGDAPCDAAASAAPPVEATTRLATLRFCVISRRTDVSLLRVAGCPAVLSAALSSRDAAVATFAGAALADAAAAGVCCLT